jgi:hypothetical protein
VGEAVGLAVAEGVGFGVGEGAPVGLAVGALVGCDVEELMGAGLGAATVGLLLSFEQPAATINRNVARSVTAQFESHPPKSASIRPSPPGPLFRVSGALAHRLGKRAHQPPRHDEFDSS